MNIRKTRKILCGALVAVCFASPALAQLAPPPRKAPREPVQRQHLVEPKAEALSRAVDGVVAVLDTERLRIRDVDFRLFGVVPPQLSAPFGPQARALLDKLVSGGTVSCQIRDRDREGRFLASCRNGQQQDLALELLRRGLAVAARGSLAHADVGTAYLEAEQQAQGQKLGLWRGAETAPSGGVGKELAALSPKAEPTPVAPVVAPPPVQNAAESASKGSSVAVSKGDGGVVQSAPPVADDVQRTAMTVEGMELPMNDGDLVGVVARYQILLAAMVLGGSLLGSMGLWLAGRERERRRDVAALAAALRGELGAARSVCVARLGVMTARLRDEGEAGDGTSVTSWPRVRTAVFQARVGDLGFLGAELARQIASIYGQASDYAAYYASKTAKQMPVEEASKLKALEMLVRYIDEVLPRLASIEGSGDIKVEKKTVKKPEKPRAVVAQASQARTPVYAQDASPAEPPAVKVVEQEEKYSTADETVYAETVSEAAAVDAGAVGPAAHIWDKIRAMTAKSLAAKKRSSGPGPEDVPLSPEEMEALAYGEGPAAERAAREGVEAVESGKAAGVL